MKRKYLFFILVLCILCFTGCIGNEKERPDKKVYDIQKTEEQLFQIQDADSFRFLGAQYYQGQPIQLWQESRYFDESGQVILEGDVYLYREDGSRVLLM